MRTEPYAGTEFYRQIKKLVAVTIYIPKQVREGYKKVARKLKRRGLNGASAQKLMAKALIRGVALVGKRK